MNKPSTFFLREADEFNPILLQHGKEPGSEIYLLRFRNDQMGSFRYLIEHCRSFYADNILFATNFFPGPQGQKVKHTNEVLVQIKEPQIILDIEGFSKYCASNSMKLEVEVTRIVWEPRDGICVDSLPGNETLSIVTTADDDMNKIETKIMEQLYDKYRCYVLELEWKPKEVNNGD